MSSEMMSLITFVKSYLTWLSSLTAELATFILPIAFVVLLIVELNHPNRSLPLKLLRQSYQTNIGLFIFNSLIIGLLSVTPLAIIAERYADWGLLNYVSSPVWKALLSFVALDLLLYGWHKISHSFDVLWMFHKVHHNDPYLNVSTAIRLHIIELFIITALKSAYIILLGVDKTQVIANETLLTLFILFHHSNIAFSGEKRLGLLIITPYLHRTHHSTERLEHDSNYGAAFSLWDRFFGTLAEHEPVEIGIKGSSPQTVLGLVKFGFTTAIPTPVPSSEAEVKVKAMIAEAAYYKAEKRAFKPGNELRDWLEAKKEINNRIYGKKYIRQ